LLAIHSALQTLERGLLLQSDESISIDDSLYSTERIQRLVSQYRELTYLITKMPSTHPFLTSQSVRIQKVKSALQKDIQEAIKFNKSQERNPLEIFNILQISSTIDIPILP
jgi:CRISPR/Cas system Type II protein with McrA/HNH and RuvC-like nuclease domain